MSPGDADFAREMARWTTHVPWLLLPLALMAIFAAGAVNEFQSAAAPTSDDHQRRLWGIIFASIALNEAAIVAAYLLRVRLCRSDPMGVYAMTAAWITQPAAVVAVPLGLLTGRLAYAFLP